MRVTYGSYIQLKVGCSIWTVDLFLLKIAMTLRLFLVIG